MLVEDNTAYSYAYTLNSALSTMNCQEVTTDPFWGPHASDHTFHYQLYISVVSPKTLNHSSSPSVSAFCDFCKVCLELNLLFISF